jgi:hypothetical protein
MAGTERAALFQTRAAIYNQSNLPDALTVFREDMRSSPRLIDADNADSGTTD